ncbi:MAG: UTP--glucose-1-phosphate uridylyltransferase [Chloroflexi bacterium]|nr:UTP--glucose-1-phosphate uridylyltransferase [Chloroflexota bacterium]
MSTSIDQKFALFEERMRNENMPELAIESFKYYYSQLVDGQTGFIRAADIEAVENIPDVESISKKTADVGQEALSSAVILKLNGGLGTSMGLEKAKSLLQIKGEYSFLDIIAQQALALDIPLVLMNSFATEEDSLGFLEKYPKLWKSELALSFLQHKVPKVKQSDLSPVIWDENPELEWAPPGHGNIYPALITSGMLDKLLESGFKYAFISNSDNLGAVIDTKILGHLVETNAPFLMEVAERTEMDVKGGFPVCYRDGKLVLWEIAQCPPEEKHIHQDIQHFDYFNTNSIWINLVALKEEMQKKENNLQLPMIRNEKTVDPKKSDSTPVYSLETAQGAAISAFEGSQPVRIQRNRFNPVKTTNELLAIRSDAYILTSDYRIILNPERTLPPPVVTLDSKYYRLIQNLEDRFPVGVPSLLNCKSLSIEGDIKFGKNVVFEGDVRLVNATKDQVVIEDIVVVDQEWRAD